MVCIYVRVLGVCSPFSSKKEVLLTENLAQVD